MADTLELEPMRFGTEIGQWQSTRSGLVQITAENRHKFLPEDDETAYVIAGRTLAEWREFAKRDDCLDQMVPSDLRALVNAI